MCQDPHLHDTVYFFMSYWVTSSNNYTLFKSCWPLVGVHRGENMQDLKFSPKLFPWLFPSSNYIQFSFGNNSMQHHQSLQGQIKHETVLYYLFDARFILLRPQKAQSSYRELNEAVTKRLWHLAFHLAFECDHSELI